MFNHLLCLQAVVNPLQAFLNSFVYHSVGGCNIQWTRTSLTQQMLYTWRYRKRRPDIQYTSQTDFDESLETSPLLSFRNFRKWYVEGCFVLFYFLLECALMKTCHDDEMLWESFLQNWTPVGEAIVNSSPPSATYMRQWIREALVQIMACRLFGANPLSEPMLEYCYFDPQEQTSVKYSSKYKTFHSQKCILKWLLRNGGHFIQGEKN